MSGQTLKNYNKYTGDAEMNASTHKIPQGSLDWAFSVSTAVCPKTKCDYCGLTFVIHVSSRLYPMSMKEWKVCIAYHIHKWIIYTYITRKGNLNIKLLNRSHLFIIGVFLVHGSAINPLKSISIPGLPDFKPYQLLFWKHVLVALQNTWEYLCRRSITW